MPKKLIFPLIALLVSGLALANDQMRHWTLASGEKQQAEILAFDEATRQVTLRLPDQKEVKYQEADFSTIDRAWILEWVERDEEARAMLVKVGGKVTEHRAVPKFTTDYAVYHPPAATEGSMLILFHPGGNGRRRIYSYIEAAAGTGMTLVSLDAFRNSDKDDGMLERFEELLPHIESTVPHDSKRMYMGGSSGGAMRAYTYSAKVKRPWAGIFAGGGWLGGVGRYDLPFPAMRVALVNGDKDRGANRYVDPDTARLQKSGCIVSVHAFEGGHQLPPPSVQKKAMAWLLEGPFPSEQAP
jgi:hypothetical protein